MPRPRARGTATAWLAVRWTAAGVALGAVLYGSPAAAVTAACGDQIGPGGAFRLEQDLESCDGAGVALTVVGPVTLEMDGREIRCAVIDPAGGIELAARQVNISGGTVRGCRFGISAAGEGRHRIENVHVRSSIDVGIDLVSDRSQLRGADATNGGGDGVRVRGARARLDRNVASDNGLNGFTVIGDGCKLTDNTAVNNARTGVEVSGDRNTLTRTVCTTRANHGLLVTGDDNRVRWTTAARNVRSGILVTGSRNDLERNRAVHNASHGFEILQGDSNRLRGGFAVSNALNGFDLDGTGNAVTGNRATNNNLGIRVRGGAGNAISSNAALGSAGADLRDDTACAAAE